MNKDAAFCRAIQDDPTDDDVRLVYADWLEDQGDPRGEFLHLIHTLAELPLADRRAEQFQTRLDELQVSIDPKWVVLVLSGRVNLRYHRKAFALLNEKPVLSKVNVRKIEKWEKQSGRKLPLSVREWYSFEGAEERLCCDPEYFTAFSLQRALNGVEEDPLYPSLLNFPLGYWGSGATSHVRLDDVDDPAVAFGSTDDCLDGTFSSFVFRRLWNRLMQSDWYADLTWDSWEQSTCEDDPAFPLLQANESVFGKADMSYLDAHYSPGVHQLVAGSWKEGRNPATGERIRVFAPPSILRYFEPHARIQVICKGNPQKRKTEAHWQISADTSQQLVETIAQHLWGHRTLAQTLTGFTNTGKAALATLRRRFRKVDRQA